MAVWACRDCVSDTGHGYASSGWCGVGGHQVEGRIEFHPDTDAVGGTLADKLELDRIFGEDTCSAPAAGATATTATTSSG